MQAAGTLHAAALAAVHAAAFPPEGRWGAEAMALQLGLPGAFGFLDEAGGMVLARVILDEAEILTIGVAAEARGQGLGRDLLLAAMAEAARRGAARMLLEVEQGNAAARGLYGSVGFSQVGRRRNYYGPGRDALVLAADLELPLAD